MDIRCRKTNCKFNDGFTCLAKGILIGREIQCETVQVLTEKNLDTTKKIFEEIPHYENYREAKDINIECHANCLFNNEGHCEANGITVNDLKNIPFCITFLKK